MLILSTNTNTNTNTMVVVVRMLIYSSNHGCVFFFAFPNADYAYSSPKNTFSP